MRITDKWRDVAIQDDVIRLRRTVGGVVEIFAADDLGVARATGFVHAHDRMVQLVLTRLIGQGRLSECLQASDETLGVDLFMRSMGFARTAFREAQRASDEVRAYGDAYAAGVNAYLRAHARAVELRAFGVRPEPWTLADTLLVIKLMTYVNLAQTQTDAEHLIVESILAGADLARLKQLFAGDLDGLDEEILDHLSRVQLFDSLLPRSSEWMNVVPAMHGSNAWAVAPERSATGAAFQCNDPHLECNRLPPVWYELIAHTDDDYRCGATVPGVPGVVMGRTSTLSFGFTYGFMDMVDYTIEECRDGAYRSADEWKPLQRIDEVILRKRSNAVVATFWECERGVLETDPHASQVADGSYLCRNYTAYDRGAAESLWAIARTPQSRSVEEAQAVVREASISANWVLADRDGNIGYQQSGYAPRRQHSGLHPVPGWKQEPVGELVAATELASELNPDSGLIVSANGDHNPPGGPRVINLHQGSYRAERIRELLTSKKKLNLDDMRRIQSDVTSAQAQRFMEVIGPLLPDTPKGRILAEWDCHYSTPSRAAPLFEDIYNELMRVVFEPVFGAQIWSHLQLQTGLVDASYFEYFDDVLLGADESWYPDGDREACIKSILAEQLAGTAEGLPTWGELREVRMHNILFAGQLPTVTRVDRGPIQIPGSRATIVQGSIYTSHERLSTFTPSWRYITEMGSDEVFTIVAGGPSGRPWSRLYDIDIEGWLAFDYKRLVINRET